MSQSGAGCNLYATDRLAAAGSQPFHQSTRLMGMADANMQAVQVCAHLPRRGPITPAVGVEGLQNSACQLHEVAAQGSRVGQPYAC